MAEQQQVKEVLRIVILCVLWYLVSSMNNVVGKTLLTDFPYPVTVTMVQLVSITLYSGPLFTLWGIRRYADISWRYHFQMVIPLALGKFFSSVSSHISIWKVPVSYAHTVKATMPLFTVVLSRIIIGEKQTTKVYLSLVPIICGVMIATMTELSFDVIGLISALFATMGFSLQNIFSKKVLKETSIHHFQLLHVLAKMALCLFLPVWFLLDFRKIINDDTWLNGDFVFQSYVLLFFDGLLNFAQNVIAFSILNLVSPLTYSVANVTKRISVITVSLIMLRNPVTLPNVCGMAIAISGVFCYNKIRMDAQYEKGLPQYNATSTSESAESLTNYAKYDANVAKQKTPVLPVTNNVQSRSVLLDHDFNAPPRTTYLHTPLSMDKIQQNGGVHHVTHNYFSSGIQDT